LSGDIRQASGNSKLAPGETTMAKTALLAKIDAAIAEKNLLKHPFYLDWQMGKLSREELQLYAAQYYRHVEAFPKHLRVLAARTEGSIRNVILENLAEEEDPSRPHPKLWRDFAEAVGVREDDITCGPALLGAQAVVETFRGIVGDRSVAEAVAALYAYEAQVPEIATTKIEGLKKFYGVNSREGLAYFEVHEEADKAHRAAWRNWLLEHAEGSDDEILATTNEALDAMWRLLDAVHRKQALPATAN